MAMDVIDNVQGVEAISGFNAKSFVSSIHVKSFPTIEPLFPSSTKFMLLIIRSRLFLYELINFVVILPISRL